MSEDIGKVGRSRKRLAAWLIVTVVWVAGVSLWRGLVVHGRSPDASDQSSAPNRPPPAQCRRPSLVRENFRWDHAERLVSADREIQAFDCLGAWNVELVARNGVSRPRFARARFQCAVF